VCLGLAGLFALLAHRNNPGDSSSLATTDKTGPEKTPNDKRQPPPERDKKPQPPADNPQPLAKEDKEVIPPAPPAKKDKEEKPLPPPPDRAELLKEVTNSIGMKLMLIPAGRFTMGSPPYEDVRSENEEQHEVEITRPYYLGAYLVTQDQYVLVMDSPNPSFFSATGGGKERVAQVDKRRLPVESVSWSMAQEFCRKLSDLPPEKRAKRVYRLPTEAEWEYACREAGRSSTPFCFGNTLSSRQANFDGNYPYGFAAKGPYLQRTTPVGTYEPNELGLYDMHGNLYQWCQDWYGYYQYGHAKDPQGPGHGKYRVLRGGAWSSNGSSCRAAHRFVNSPTDRNSLFGIRVVLVAGDGAP
jgi:formylglycine-generating enzyme required for sulfatase activity